MLSFEWIQTISLSSSFFWLFSPLWWTRSVFIWSHLPPPLTTYFAFFLDILLPICRYFIVFSTVWSQKNLFELFFSPTSFCANKINAFLLPFVPHPVNCTSVGTPFLKWKHVPPGSSLLFGQSTSILNRLSIFPPLKFFPVLQRPLKCFPPPLFVSFKPLCGQLHRRPRRELPL